jgi:hypothetical protein
MLSRTLRAVEARDYAGTRYVQLLKLQYSLLADAPEPLYRADTTFDLLGYAFYPDFIKALRLRRQILESDKIEQAGKSGGDAKSSGLLSAADRAAQVKQVADARKRILTRLRKTPKTQLNPQNRGLYEWHVGEALRPEQFTRSVSSSKATGKTLLQDARGSDDTAETTSKAVGKSRNPPER